MGGAYFTCRIFSHANDPNVTFNSCIYLLIYLFGVLRRFQHYTGHIMMSSFVGRGNQFIQLVKVLYCKLLTNGKKLQTFPHMVQGLDCRPQSWETRVLVCRFNKYLILFELFVPLKSNYTNYFSSFFKCWLVNKKSIIC